MIAGARAEVPPMADWSLGWWLAIWGGYRRPDPTLMVRDGWPLHRAHIYAAGWFAAERAAASLRPWGCAP